MTGQLVPKQHCVLCTEDPELQENVLNYLKDVFCFWTVTNPAAALAQVERRTHCLILIDLRFENALPLLMAFSRKKGCVVIALGEPTSAPYIEAVNIGLYAIEDINAHYATIQALLEQGAKHLSSIEESESITARLADSAARHLFTGAPGATLSGSLAVNKIEVISDVLRKLHSPIEILETVLADVSRQYLPTRIGVLCQIDGHYQLRSEVRCPPETWSYRIPAEDPFVRWLKIHGQLLSRKSLAVMENSESRLMLGQMLDTFGADLLIPLSQGSTLLGWIFLGKQINGQSYASDQFPALLSLADQISGIIKFIIEVERTAVRQRHAQGIIASLPYGLLLVDETSRIIWSNDLARNLLSLEEEHFEKEVDFIDTILADVVNRAAAGNGRIVGTERQGKKDGTYVSIHGRTMDANPKTVLVVVEESSERVAELKRAERVREIALQFRSSLTLLKTLSQLLPEKADDPLSIHGFGESMEKQVEELTSLSRELGDLRKADRLPS